jgi:hypothetical protein
MRRIMTSALVALAALSGAAACSPSAPAPTFLEAAPTATASGAALPSPSAGASPTAVASPSAKPSPKPKVSTQPPAPKPKLVIKSATLSASWSGHTLVVSVTVKTTGYGSADADVLIGDRNPEPSTRKGITVTGTGSNTIVKKVSYTITWCSGPSTAVAVDLWGVTGSWPDRSGPLYEKKCP